MLSTESVAASRHVDSSAPAHGPGLRVLLISPSFPPGAEGEAEHALQISERLAALGHRVSVLTNRRPQVKRPHAVAVQATVDGWQWRHLPALLWRIRSLRPDAIVLVYTAWLFDDHPMITFLPSLLRQLGLRVRLLLIAETEFGPRTGNAFVRLGRKLMAGLAGGVVSYAFGTLLRDADAVMVLGPTILARLGDHEPGLAARGLVVPPPPLVVTPGRFGAAERQQARTRLGLQAGDLVLAYFGYVYPGKGVDTLFEAVRRLAAQGRPVRLLMVGGGRGGEVVDDGGPRAAYEARMMAMSQQAELIDRVHWQPGYESGSAGPSLDLLAADLAVLPFDDGVELRRSSVAVVAAMGLPIVTTAPTRDEPAFVHDDTVLLVPRQDTAALCAAIVRVVEEPGCAERLREGAQRLARDWYSWDKAMRSIDAALCAQKAC